MKRKFRQAKSKLKHVVTSYVLWSLLALVGVDGGCRLIDRLGYWPVTPYQTAHHSWVWWVAADYRQQKGAPDVALLGSSLMMAAVHGGDAAYLKSPQKVALHHRSILLEDRLNKKFNKSCRTFSFALGGEMASDAYVLARNLFTGNKQPKVIIYGIAPRDFMDNALKNPASTEIFKYMEKLQDMPDIAVSARKSVWDLVEYALSKISFIYGHRADFVYIQHSIARNLLCTVCGARDMNEIHTTFPIRKQSLLELPEDAGENEVLVHPPSPSGEAYTDNLPEYRYRYSSFQEKQFKEQVSYLERLLALCKDRGIKIILVNMPLTRDNINVMPAGFYARYSQTMQHLCREYQGQFLDLNSEEDFPKKYFADSVHLNSAGGMRFFEVLSERLFADSRVATTIKDAVH